jgi:hypothetical protein
MKRVMDCCWAAKNRGLIIKPEGKLSGKVGTTEFEIKGISDSDYSTNLENRHSVTDYSVFLNSAPFDMKSKSNTLLPYQ